MNSSSSSNDDEEPKVCTVFSSSSSSGPSSTSKTVFDTIAFSTPKKDTSPPSITSSQPPVGSVESLQGSDSIDTASLFQPHGQNPQRSQSSTGVDGLPVVEEPFPALSGLGINNSSSLLLQESLLSPLEEHTTNLETSMVPTFDADQTTILPREEQQMASVSDLVDEAGGIPLPTPIDIFDDNYKTSVNKNSEFDNVENVPEVTQEFLAEDATKQLAQAVEGLTLDISGIEQQGQGEGGPNYVHPLGGNNTEDAESPIPTANSLFANAPDVPFPVGQFLPPPQSQQVFPVSVGSSTSSGFFGNNSHPSISNEQRGPGIPGGIDFPQLQQSQLYNPVQTAPVEASPPFLRSQASPTNQPPVDTFSTLSYSPIDAAYDAWIPKEETSKILMSIATAVHSGTYFPEQSHMTTPGIIYEDDLIDKVGVNMGRIFGEAEASKRQILNADSVTQDDNGLRELIKLGCYRSAINLTKRLLTLYGQGPGKIGHFSKHNPHTLQLWFTRISLLIRIREFAIAESEIEAFKDFDNPDLYYEYYPDSYGGGRRGCMVPFHFRLLAAEVLQYSRKHNETIERLAKILKTIHKILQNIDEGVSEDGSGVTIDAERKSASLEIWRKREIRVYYSIANASLFSKDYHNTFKYLILLCEKDKAKEPQIKSAIGRLFLQLGDLSTANKYFQLAAELRSGDSESEQVENLVDAGMISIAQGAYPEAFALLQQALLIHPDNFMITNNMAVCLLYMGKVKDALALMETTVKNNTPQLLQENVLLNLSTIYELENSDGHKKNSLLKMISEYKGDGINLASLKMPNLI